MREYIRPSRTMLALLCATTFAAACGDKKADDTALTTDSTLGRDLALAGAVRTGECEIAPKCAVGSQCRVVGFLVAARCGKRGRTQQREHGTRWTNIF
ncbi:MAG: hypothetical protein ACO1Q7_03660, partial [Gemmatimonas sp.]